MPVAKARCLGIILLFPVSIGRLFAPWRRSQNRCGSVRVLNPTMIGGIVGTVDLEMSLNVRVTEKLVLCLGRQLQLRLKESRPRSHFYMLHEVCDYILWLNTLRLILTNTNLICELQRKISIRMRHLYGHIRETCHIRWAPGQKPVNA